MWSGQLEPLPLAAGQRCERLAEAEVAEPDVGEPAEDGVRGRRARLAGAEELPASVTDIASTSLMSRPPSVVVQHRRLEPLPSHSSQVEVTPAIIARSV
jgi:hypothetical protein